MLGESDATLRQRISAAKADVANIISAKSVTRTAQSLFFIVLLLYVFIRTSYKGIRTETKKGYKNVEIILFLCPWQP